MSKDQALLPRHDLILRATIKCLERRRENGNNYNVGSSITLVLAPDPKEAIG